MVGVESSCFELVLSLLNLEASVLLGDDVELADHLSMADEVIGVDVEGHDLFAALVPPHTFLEVEFALGSPLIIDV